MVTRVDMGRELRVAEVAAARQAVGAVVPALLASARERVAALGAVRTAPTLTSDERATAAGEGDTGVEAALADVVALRLEGDGPDVAAARTALAALAEAGLALDEAVDAEVAELDRLASFDGRLADVVAEWDRPGSRGDRRTALQDAAGAAAELEAEASATVAAVPCLEVWQRRAAAARTVGERSAELAGLAGGSTGGRYDAARDAWRGDATGLGAPLHVLDADGADCWEATAPAATAVAALDAAAAALEAALDPADLRR